MIEEGVGRPRWYLYVQIEESAVVVVRLMVTRGIEHEGTVQVLPIPGRVYDVRTGTYPDLRVRCLTLVITKQERSTRDLSMTLAPSTRAMAAPRDCLMERLDIGRNEAFDMGSGGIIVMSCAFFATSSEYSSLVTYITDFV
jgi:hypothetical protein